MKTKFKSGAASFYVVAFSTLILVIIAASFATAIIAEITRASNDDLSQSAYDAALAGVEDAKLALISYQNCIKSGVTIDGTYRPSEYSSDFCKDVIYWMNHPDCDMVAHILGRIGVNDSGEVPIDESSDGSNEMNQAYTCVMIKTNLDDYRANLTSSNPYKVVRVNLDGVEASEITAVRVSWYSNVGNLKLKYTNVLGSKVAFQPLTKGGTNAATPPTLAVQLLQTVDNFSLAQLNGPSSGEATDRATVFLVPTDNSALAKKNEDNEKNISRTYTGVYDGSGDNVVTAAQIASTNNQAKNFPYMVYCPYDSTTEYVCSALLNLPAPLGEGARNKDTFMFVISLPYGQPDTDFSLEFICQNASCGRAEVESGDDSGYQNNVAQLKGVQVLIDSTGRANDLYRRVEVRLESSDEANTNALSLYAIQAFGDESGMAIDKNKIVTSE